MGRLFWKFFIFVWLAQMAGMVAVGTTFWLKHHADEQSRLRTEPPPGPEPRGGPPLRQRPRPFPVEPLVATLLASLICAALLARYFSRPIRNLRDAFDAAAGGNLKVRLGASMGRRRDELADLGHDFDRMADQLSMLMDAQRRLLHDVSHELRSPLARLQVAVGLARQQPEKLDATMARIEQEAVRIDSLVGELLTLARLEAGDMPDMREDIVMNDLLQGIADDACFEAEANGQRVTVESHCDAIVQGKPELLHHAIENVVRNALKHTSAGGCVKLETAMDSVGNRLMVSVMDEGPGVPEAELPHIFEPFFRGSGAKGNDGYGLGLAIARRAVLAHGGDIRAFNLTSGGLCVEMLLPARLVGE